MPGSTTGAADLRTGRPIRPSDRFRIGSDDGPPPITIDTAQRKPAGRSFGHKSAWLAVRATGHAQVADALGLDDPTPSTWAAGLAAVDDGESRPAPLFVGVAIDGWVLVPLSLPLMDAAEFDPGALSRRFGEVQRFATQRVVEAHEWERWVDGQPLRRYGWLGESGQVPFNEGEPGELEEDLLPDSDADWDAWETADEERVIELAGAWSVDPTRLDERTDIDDTVLLGRRR